mgnify:CR=1 FL=1
MELNLLVSLGHLNTYLHFDAPHLTNNHNVVTMVTIRFSYSSRNSNTPLWQLVINFTYNTSVSRLFERALQWIFGIDEVWYKMLKCKPKTNKQIFSKKWKHFLCFIIYWYSLNERRNSNIFYPEGQDYKAKSRNLYLTFHK